MYKTERFMQNQRDCLVIETHHMFSDVGLLLLAFKLICFNVSCYAYNSGGGVRERERGTWEQRKMSSGNKAKY